MAPKSPPEEPAGVKQPLHLAKPPKPIAEMSDEELRAFAEQVVSTIQQTE